MDGDQSLTETGPIEWRVSSKTVSSTSVLWNILVTRDITFTEHRGEVLPDTTWIVNDTSTSTITETDKEYISNLVPVSCNTISKMTTVYTDTLKINCNVNDIRPNEVTFVNGIGMVEYYEDLYSNNPVVVSYNLTNYKP